jgi:hypothetical protein
LPAGDNDNGCLLALEKETPGTRPARLILRMLAIVIVCVAYHAVVVRQVVLATKIGCQAEPKAGPGEIIHFSAIANT